MKITAISDKYFEKCSFEGDELLHNKQEKRPYVIILKLNYMGNKHDFAIPFRSGIKSYFDKTQYYSLPPRSSTKPNEIHGLHYIKMFPVTKEYLQKYHLYDDKYNQLIQKIVTDNKDTIITEAQNYLDGYSSGERFEFGTKIHELFCRLYDIDVQDEVAISKELDNISNV